MTGTCTSFLALPALRKLWNVVSGVGRGCAWCGGMLNVDKLCSHGRLASSFFLSRPNEPRKRGGTEFNASRRTKETMGIKEMLRMSGFDLP